MQETKKAKLVYKNKIISNNRICEMVIWKLLEKNIGGSYTINYHLYYGDNCGNCLIRYDNEHEKLNCRHHKKRKEKYIFVSVEKLIEDFLNDIKRNKG